MKKNLLFSLFLFAIATCSQAQNFNKNAVGLRFGSGGEISYQRGLNANNRLEIDLGLRNNNNSDAFKLTGIYQWVYHIEGGFNWYAGVGGGLGSYNYTNNGTNENGAFVFAAGDLGIEYNFEEAPIQLALDVRPEIYFGKNQYVRNILFSDLGLSIRYRFN